MILANGTVRVRKDTGAGAGADGYPDNSPGVDEWGAAVSCFIIPANLNYYAKSQNGNVYIDASYEVLIEYAGETLASLKEGALVKLELYQETSGEYPVVWMVRYEAVDIIKLVV
jgi:hypothetical protein